MDYSATQPGFRNETIKYDPVPFKPREGMAWSIREYFCPTRDPPKPLDDRYMPPNLLKAILDSGYYLAPGYDRSNLNWPESISSCVKSTVFTKLEHALAEPIIDRNSHRGLTEASLYMFYRYPDAPQIREALLHSFLFFFQSFYPYVALKRKESGMGSTSSGSSNLKQSGKLQTRRGFPRPKSSSQKEFKLWEMMENLPVYDFTLGPPVLELWRRGLLRTGRTDLVQHSVRNMTRNLQFLMDHDSRYSCYELQIAFCIFSQQIWFILGERFRSERMENTILRFLKEDGVNNSVVNGVTAASIRRLSLEKSTQRVRMLSEGSLQAHISDRIYTNRGSEIEEANSTNGQWLPFPAWVEKVVGTKK